MKRQTRHPIWSWIIHTPWVLTVIAILAVVVLCGRGAGTPLLRRLVGSRLERMTGAKLEFRALSIRWLAMRASITGLVIHGKEPVGTEPLLTAEEVQAGLRIDSFWGRKVSLSELVVQQLHVHIRVDKNGNTNLPTPPRANYTKKP